MCGCECSVPRGSGPQSRFLLLAISVERVSRGMHGNQTKLTCQTAPVPRLRTSSVQSALPTPHTLSPHKLNGCEGVDQNAARAWAHIEHATSPA